MLGRLEKNIRWERKDLNKSKVVLERRVDFLVVSQRRGRFLVAEGVESFIIMSANLGVKCVTSVETSITSHLSVRRRSKM